MKKILIVFGTRPEAIKIAPVIKELKLFFDVKVCVTAQHRDMLDQVLKIFDILPEYDLDIMRPNQDLFDVTNKVLLGVKEVILKEKPNIVIVHGDTTTTMAASLAAFYLQIPVGHIEAGLRTHNIESPFPEELNRKLTSLVTKIHFAPTVLSRQNLLNEKVPESQIFITGNTVIDSLFFLLKKARSFNFSIDLLQKLPFLALDKKNYPLIILVTGHRRENFGKGFEEICFAIKKIAELYPNVEIVYPVHLNPNVRKPVNHILSGIKNIHLIEPLNYLPFIKLMDSCHFILTDSGGIQEEAPSLGKPVLVMRNTTERPEGIKAGTIKLVGIDKEKIFNEASKLLSSNKVYNKMAKSVNPYGDGLASQRIAKILLEDNLW
ncbi:UDP-N-acetylglucosamine 2-epimerase (non-hydrolyzing) [Candidatus Pseudothioglobus singularis]|nr:UDP-N-acetylglucosamine 2-epimerase (non-hydrolyzing) [Candidatus Pseudothioglobus singularis]